ncbi:MAG TPA: type II toxin-antitoxin system VapC family toxin [Vicinamibacterales bacterium]|nr:type II toxin-antitoxin system VapC family toxin [Vicinamibacterales bacterium]
MARDRPLTVIVDSNVIAYYLLGTEPFVDEVHAFWHRPLAPAAPTLWEAEVSNVLWMAARTGLIDKATALRRLNMTVRLGIAVCRRDGSGGAPSSGR